MEEKTEHEQAVLKGKVHLNPRRWWEPVAGLTGASTLACGPVGKDMGVSPMYGKCHAGGLPPEEHLPYPMALTQCGF